MHPSNISDLGLIYDYGLMPYDGFLENYGRVENYGLYGFRPTSLFRNNEQGLWYDPSDLTTEKTSWRRNLLTYSQDFENAAWTKSNASLLSNLALYSQDFDNAAWVKGTGGSVTANTVVAPDGTTTADAYTWATSTATYAFLNQTVTATSNIANTFSIYLKRPTGSGSRTVRLVISDVTTSTANSSTFTVTEDWQQFTFTRTSPNTTGQVGVGLLAGSTGTPIASGEVLHVWGAQLVVGSTPQTYTRSLATAAPVMFSDPLGGTMADKFIENTSLVADHRLNSASPTLAGYTYTASVYVKAAERSFVRFWVVTVASTSFTVNLSDGSYIFQSNSGGVTANVTNVGGGWYRVAYTYVTTSPSSAGLYLTIAYDSAGTVSGTGDGVSGIYVFGAQVEQASTASAYQRITDFTSDFLAAFPTHALYQESTFLTPVTALGQSVGGVVDKRLGGLAALGPELVTNGDFSAGSTGWTVDTGWFVAGGEAYAYGSTAGGLYTSAAAYTTGKVYRVQFDKIGSSSLTIYLRTSTAVTTSASGRVTVFVVAGSSATRGIEFYLAGAGVIDNISVREVPGNHAIQATSASRPTLQARANLLTYSEQFDNAAWSKSNSSVTANAGVAPDGTTTADKLVEDTATSTHRLLNNTGYTTTTGAPYTYTVYAKAAERTSIFVADNSLTGASFNLSNGTVSNIGSGVTASIVSVGNGWYRCVMTRIESTAAGRIVVYLESGGATSYTGDGTSGVLLWGAQAEQASTASTYQRIVTATDYADVGLPRNLLFDGTDDSLATVGNVDFATWTGSEARRNLLTMPSMFDDAAWAKSNATVTANAVASPDGTTTADALIPNTTSTLHYAQQSITRTTGSYTYSVYAKPFGYNFVAIQVRDLAGTFKNAQFNVSTGAVVSSSGATATSITDAGNGWYRCVFTFDSGTGATGPNDAIFVGSSVGNWNTGFAGDGTSGVYIWGAQLETGSTATTFQNVGTDKVSVFSGLTKSADPAGGGVVLESSVNSSLSSGTFALFAPFPAGTDFYWRSRGTVSADAGSTLAAPATRVTTGLGDIGGDSSVLRLNGVQVNSATTDQGTGTYSSQILYIGRRGGSSIPLNGRIFQLIVRGAATDSVTVTNAEQYVAQKTGLVI